MSVMVYVVIVLPNWVYLEYLHIYRASEAHTSQSPSLRCPEGFSARTTWIDGSSVGVNLTTLALVREAIAYNIGPRMRAYIIVP